MGRPPDENAGPPPASGFQRIGDPVAIADSEVPLYEALIDCRVPDHRLQETANRLIEIPATLAWTAPETTPDPDLAELLDEVIGFDGDMAARMLRRDQGRVDPNARWKSLTRAEQARAKRLWQFAVSPDFETSQSGRPSQVASSI